MEAVIAKIKSAIHNRRTYIVGCTAVATVLVAWAAGEVTGAQCVTAVFVAVQTMLLRAGIAKI